MIRTELCRYLPSIPVMLANNGSGKKSVGLFVKMEVELEY